MKISAIGFGILAAALLCGAAEAAETYYGVGTQALPLQQSGGTARAMGMGSAVVAVSQGSASLLWNPAGLSRMDSKEIGIHHNSGLGDIVQEIAVFGMPLGEVKEEGKGGSMGGLAASVGYVNYGKFDGTNLLGEGTGGYHASDFLGSLGWGMEIIPGVSGGITVKGNHANFDSKKFNTFSSDIGFLWNAIPNLDLGLGYSNINLGGGMNGSDVASGWRLGAGYTIDRHWLLAASTELQEKAMKRVQFGTEYLIGNLEEKANVLALRGGYQLSFPNRELGVWSGLSMGLGYTITRSIAVDYAMLPAGDLGISHRLSVTFKFNGPAKAKPVVAAAAVPAAADALVYKSVVLEDSHFDFDSSKLKPEGMKALRENIKLLKKNPKAQVRVAGYTSMSGTAEYNQRLSERRAFAVRDYLVAEGGIAQNRITTIGYGETRAKNYEKNPGDTDTKAAKSNMRVLFDVTVK